MITSLLEWSAFLSSMCCVFCYGHSKRQGAIMGLVTAALFIVWGLASGVYAALVTNIFFVGLHGRNLARALREQVPNTRPRHRAGPR